MVQKAVAGTAAFICTVLIIFNQKGKIQMENKVKLFIKENFQKTVRTNTIDNGDLIGVPYPYTVPCIDDMFQEMYYWDTYFTNVGLLLTGNVDQAINNAENIAYLINKYGKMPNGTRTYYLNRSQPPFFSQMVMEIFEITKDSFWLEKIYPSIEREYDFWQTKRLTPSGLNRYYTDDTVFGKEYAEYLCERLSLSMPSDEKTIEEYEKSMIAFGESGWDCTSRFELNAHKFNPICLNSLLYGMEKNLAYFSEILENGKTEHWEKLSENRKELMNKIMCEHGVFYDYNFEKREKSQIFSAASFYPLFFNLATKEQAQKVVSLLPLLEKDYGIAGCENKETVKQFQWDYPNGWACLHFPVFSKLASTKSVYFIAIRLASSIYP